ncbi:MAG: hypothetical protein A2W91_14715 [Bacteroidetes bacterium GWF2_38_335]|nr:MAG: hypothetical protein A2W91_14715 [Bacteroidetes bacterium GWF2_38_335]OFY78454.1 MAG: hypothetical protein A2281_16025 [Bacteroidetes bacterium RIFOXYA12_FULL_38_20]HBS88400.1 hypothetical protein [Bacteroidales bacterium]
MSEKKNIIWIYVISVLFVLINAVFIAQEQFLFALLPLGLVALLFSLFALDKLILILVFLTPFSVSLSYIMPGQSFDMFLPTEPILLVVLLIFIIKLILENNFDRKILNHPVSWAIYFNLFWMFITCISSTYPSVSFKYLLVRMWFLASFYFLATQLFKDFKNINRYIWLYVISLCIVIIYTLARHSSYGFFDQEKANVVMIPFFKDHTIYGAILGMFVPILAGFALNSWYYSARIRLLIISATVLILAAIIFSYTRAAWISVAAAFALWAVMKLRIKYYFVLTGLVTIVSLYFVFETQIIMELEQNRQDSSKNLTEHMQSISNVSSDASNLERINRWKSAIRMFNEKPLMGWGPGTYQFNYAAFQSSNEKTIISTNAGDMGNAHSEYIGPLSESGVLGMLSVLLIIGTAIYTALKLYSYTKDRKIKFISMILLLSLTTYFLHGFLNNFLDTDKASAPFWGFIGILVAMDVYHNKKEKTDSDHEKVGT